MADESPSRPARSRTRAAAGTRKKAAADTQAGRAGKPPAHPTKTSSAAPEVDPADTDTDAGADATEAGTGSEARGATTAKTDAAPKVGATADPTARRATPRPSKRTGGSSQPRTAPAGPAPAGKSGRDTKTGKGAKAEPVKASKDIRSGNPKKAAAAAEASKRYTAPIPKEFRVSPWWVPALLFGLLGAGMIVIFLNYLLWDARPLGLGVGLALILGGILTATQYR